MTLAAAQPQTLRTTHGEFPLHEYRLRLDGRACSVLHAGVVLTQQEESDYLRRTRLRLPYGLVLWPSAIALAHEVAARGPAIAGRSVLELGAGTGLPGIVAAALGGRVVQTDRQEAALAVCRRNGERNGLAGIRYRLADWSDWQETRRYDWILGADILYGDAMHPHLRRIVRESLAPGGRVLIADPFRRGSWAFLEQLQAEGWRVSVTTWSLGEGEPARAFGIFELEPTGACT